MGLADWAIDSTAVNINRNELYIAGGYSHNGLLKSSEVHTFDTETKVGPDLPFATSDQCMIQFRLGSFKILWSVGHSFSTYKIKLPFFDLPMGLSFG